MALGTGTEASGGAGSIALGWNAVAAGSNAVALGRGTDVKGDRAIGIGGRDLYPNNLEVLADYGVAIGANATVEDNATGAVSLGHSSVSNSDYTARFGSSSRPYDVDVTGDLSVDGRVNEQNVRDISYSSGHTAWSSGLSTEEVNRFGTTSTESVEVDRLDVQVKGGGTNSNFEVEAYDTGSSTVLGNTTAGSPINDVGTTSEGGDLAIRLTNSDGSDVTASITVSGHVVE